MAQDETKNTMEQTDYGMFINQFRLDIITLIRQHEMINTKICRQKMYILFNQICLNEEIFPKYTHIYVCMHVCVCVCVRVLVYVMLLYDKLLEHQEK